MPKTKKKDKKLKIGIIGTGGIAHAHMDSYRKLGDAVEVVGGSDIVKGKAKAFFEEYDMKDAKAFDHNDDLLALDLDAVSVCTYNSTHAECAIKALEAGLHVLCEKPMSVTLEEAVAMYKAARKAKKILTIGFQPRYDPNMDLVREIVGSGVLGEIYYIQTGGGRRRGMPGGTFIRKDLAGMGALGDIGCYSLDMVLSAIGYPKPLTVSAYASNRFGTNPKYNREAKNFDVDDFSVALIRLEGDIALDFRMSWAMHMDKMGDTMFFGTDAGLKIEPAESSWAEGWGGAWDGTIGPIHLYSDVQGQLSETLIPLRRPSEDRFLSKVKAFCDAVATGGSAPIPTIQSVYNQAIVDGIIRSSRSGREVEVDLPKDL
ncbi:MAG: Gfo/Idh/MocA family oxidoreductase [Firmicutes bacterium]|nr:Gfo/Idh/MocA family oxidoreductase [Bacillota bacterium]